MFDLIKEYVNVQLQKHIYALCFCNRTLFDNYARMILKFVSNDIKIRLLV